MSDTNEPVTLGSIFAPALRLAEKAVDPDHQKRLADEAERQRVAAARRAAEATARAFERRVEAFGLPEDDDLRAIALDPAPCDTPALVAFRSALEWRAKHRRGCIFIVGGPRGVGKSCAMAHVGLYALSLESLYVTARTVGRCPQNSYSDNVVRWERWLAAPLLALDDLGTETSDADHIAGLLWERYDAGRVTLVTTNLERKTIIERYFQGEIGGRLADRLPRAQGRRVADLPVGPGGLAWYTPVTGKSLRDVTARAALLDGGAR